MGIGTSSSSGGRTHAPMRIAYAVNPDARLSWGGLPAPGRDLSSARPDACHLIWAAGGLSALASAAAQVDVLVRPRLWSSSWPTTEFSVSSCFRAGAGRTGSLPGWRLG